MLYVPPSYSPSHPAPLVVVFHGAGADAANILRPFRAPAEATGSILVIPTSAGRTWDIVLGAYGRDVARLTDDLDRVLGQYAVDRHHVAAAGFSDGASYALSLGLINGRFFTHVLAFSPGFMAPTRVEGHPAIFIAHGTRDRVLPIDRCSRRIVPRLRQQGFAVEYQEFDGGHEIPATLANAAFHWFAPSPESAPG